MSTLTIILVIAAIAAVAVAIALTRGGPRVTTIETRHEEKDGDR